MSSTKTSTSFYSDFSMPSHRDRHLRLIKDKADTVRLASLHHRNHSTHLSSVKNEETRRRTHRLHSLQEELGKLAIEKEKRREAKMRKDLEIKKAERERVEIALREKIAKQEEKFVRKVVDMSPYVLEETETESLPPEESEDEYSSSSSDAASPSSPLPQTVLVNRGGLMVQIHLIGQHIHRKNPIIRYTEEQAQSPDSPGLRKLRLWGMLKRKRKPLPSPPPQRQQVNPRMMEYSQRVKKNFSPVPSMEKQLELQLRERDFLPKPIERVSLNFLSRTTKM